MSLKDEAEKRMKTRAACRLVADGLLEEIIERVSALPEEIQPIALSMLQSELQSLLRKSQ